MRLFCHSCGAYFEHSHGADLYCSEACQKQYEAELEVCRHELTATGFVQLTAIPNLWEKGGIHISIEQVMREGLDRTIVSHAQALRS